MNTYQLKLDLNKGPTYSVGMAYSGITLRQGDKRGCTVVAELYDHGTRFTEAGYTAYFVMGLPDREHYYREAATYSAGTATIIIDESLAASVAGDTIAYFELTKGGATYSTQGIKVSVLKDARADKTPGETYDSRIEQAIQELEDAIAGIDVSIEEDVAEWLDQHPEATTTVQDGSITYPKLASSLKQRLNNKLHRLVTAPVVTASDAYAAPPVALVVDGKSVQDGTPTPDAPVAIQSVETANLLSGNTETVTIASAGAFYPMTLVNLPAGTYTLSFETELTSGNWQAIYNSVESSTGQTIITTQSLATKTITFTVNQPMPYFKIFSTEAGTYRNIRLARGSAAHPYVPYGCVGLYAVGRNLWSFGQEYSRTSAGDLLAKSAMHVPAGQYTFSFDVVSFTSGSNNNAQLLMYDQSGTLVTQPVVVLNTGRVSAAVNPSRDVESLKLYVGTACTLTNFQLELGSTTTPYQPYVGFTTPIPLQGHALRSLPDGTHDELRVDADGNVTLVQRVGSYTVTGSESASSSTKYGSYRRVVSNNAVTEEMQARTAQWGNAGQGLCTHAIFKWQQTEQIAHVYIAGTTLALFAEVETAAEVLTAYAGAEILYPLRTPQEISLGTVSLPSMPAPDLTSWASCTPATDIELDYERDVTIAVERIEAAIAELATN